MKLTEIEQKLAEALAKAEEAAKATQEAELLAAELEAKKAKIGNLPDYSPSIAPTLERLVSEAGMNIHAVSVAAGLSAPTIYSVIRSQSSPRLITLAKISRVLGMTLSELMVEYERDLGHEADPQEDAKPQNLPEPWMEPLPEGAVLLGKGKTFKVPASGRFEGWTTYCYDFSPGWMWKPDWSGENEELYYAAPAVSEIAKLNGLS